MYPMFIAALFVVAKMWKQPRRPPGDVWIKQLWYVYTMEHNLAVKKKETVPFAAAWMDLENVMLSEIGQSEKDKVLYVVQVLDFTYTWDLITN